MKKIINIILLLSSITACTIEDQSVDINDLNLQTEDIECVFDPNNPPPIFNSQWQNISFVVETPIDANGDGVFSNDLLEESLCTASLIQFRDDFKASHPMYDPISLYVHDDGNGNLTQEIECNGIIDGLFPIYTQEQNTVYFCYSGQIEFTGTLSNNETILTIELPYELLFGFRVPNGNQILRQDGTVESYQNGAILTYERL